MPGSIHRVQKVVFDLHCGDQATAFEARKRLAGIFSDSLGKMLVEVFDGHSPNGRPFRIPRIEIDLGVMDLERLDDAQIRDLLVTRLRRRFLELGTDEVESVASTIAPIDTLVHFLTTGYFRWDSEAQSLPELQKSILQLSDADHRVLAARLKDVFRSRASRIRFGYQFDREFFLWVLDLLDPEAPRIVETVVPSRGGDLRFPKWRTSALTALVSLVGDLSDQTEAETRFGDRLDHILSESSEIEVTDAPQESGVRQQEELQTFYIKKAGIVLFNPFLERYFSTLDLLAEAGSFRSPETQVCAIHLLHYLATGKQHPEEHELILEKVLCGWPIEASLQKELEISKTERAESEALIAALIKHWGRLGNTSSDGLREAFLQRDGRLAFDNGRWELTVEQRGMDVLLDSLPWSLYEIQLPWMSHKLRVDWA